jgi:transcriptional regulator with XRE-family HTH domain
MVSVRDLPIRDLSGLGDLHLHGLGAYIRDQRNHAQISLRQLARQAGVSNPYLSQIERGLRKPSAEILQQIAKALRISAEALYIQAGILDEGHDGDVVSALLSDAALTERQKTVLLDIYESFRSENAARAAAEAVRAEVSDELETPGFETPEFDSPDFATPDPEPSAGDLAEHAVPVPSTTSL